MHSIEKFGLELSQKKYESNFLKKNDLPTKKIPRLLNVLKGKLDYLSMVKGKDDLVFQRLYKRYLAIKNSL